MTDELTRMKELCHKAIYLATSDRETLKIAEEIIEAVPNIIARVEKAEAELSCFELLDVQRVARIFDISENVAENGLEHGFLYRQLTVPPSEEP